jgi:hypothetical protein
MSTETKTHRILRLILFLSNSYPKSKEDCIEFLSIKNSAFYNYCNLLRDISFDLRQKDGKYWIDCKEKDPQVLVNLLHFTEAYILSNCIDSLDEKNGYANNLKHKLVSFLNQDKALDAYILKDKPAIIKTWRKAMLNKQQGAADQLFIRQQLILMPCVYLNLNRNLNEI